MYSRKRPVVGQCAEQPAVHRHEAVDRQPRRPVADHRVGQHHRHQEREQHHRVVALAQRGHQERRDQQHAGGRHHPEQRVALPVVAVQQPQAARRRAARKHDAQQQDQPRRQAVVDAVALDGAVEVVAHREDVGHRVAHEAHRVADQRPRGGVEQQRHPEGGHQRAPLPVQQREQQQRRQRRFDHQRQPDGDAGEPLVVDLAARAATGGTAPRRAGRIR